MNKRPIHLFVYPSKNKNNKYIELLVSSLRGARENVVIFSFLRDSLFEVLRHAVFNKSKDSLNIIHLNWSTVLYGSRFVLRSFFLLSINTTLLLILRYAYGFKIIWTVHNCFAHDYPHPRIDQLGRFVVRSLSHCIIVHEEKTRDEFLQKYPRKNIQHVPHGNYVDAYGARQERDINLKKSLGFTEADVLLISLGAIAPYKMNEKIIDAIFQIVPDRPEIKLLIVGKGNPGYVNTLVSLVSGRPEVVIINQFVLDKEIPKFLSVADYSIFYYDKSEMTSGGMVLSLSYGVPVIIRNIPAAEVITDQNGIVFDDMQALVNTLRSLPGHGGFTPHDIIQSTRADSWSESAKRLISIYESIG